MIVAVLALCAGIAGGGGPAPPPDPSAPLALERAGGGTPAPQDALSFWGGDVYDANGKLSRAAAYRALGRDDLVEQRDQLQTLRIAGLVTGAAIAVAGNATRTGAVVAGWLGGESDAEVALFWTGLSMELIVAPIIVGASVLLPEEPIDNEELRDLVRAQQEHAP